MGKTSTIKVTAEQEQRFIEEITREEENRIQSLEATKQAIKDAARTARRRALETEVRERYLYGDSEALAVAMAANREASEREAQTRMLVSVPEIHKQGGATRIRIAEKNALTSKYGYQIIYKKLASGSYWKMLEAKKMDSGESIAVTILDMKTMPAKKKANYDKQAIRIMRFLASNQHPNIVRIFEVFMIETDCNAFHEKVNYSLENVLKRGGVLSEERAKAWGHDLVDAIHFLHSHGIAHRAISPQTVWLTSDLKLKLGNFGFSCVFWDHQTSSRVTVERIHDKEMPYHPPEEGQEGTLDPAKQDVFCWGAVVTYMLTKEYPPKDGTFAAFAADKLAALSSDGRALLQMSVDPDPAKRPYAHHVLHHLWFKNYVVIKVAEPVAS